MTPGSVGPATLMSWTTSFSTPHLYHVSFSSDRLPPCVRFMCIIQTRNCPDVKKSYFLLQLILKQQRHFSQKPLSAQSRQDFTTYLCLNQLLVRRMGLPWLTGADQDSLPSRSQITSAGVCALKWLKEHKSLGSESHPEGKKWEAGLVTTLTAWAESATM